MDVATLTKELDDSDQDLRVEADERQQDYRRVIKKLQEYGQDIKYPFLSILNVSKVFESYRYMSTEKELDAAVVKLHEVLLSMILFFCFWSLLVLTLFSYLPFFIFVFTARRERYNKEVERQKYNDSVCQEFADVAEEFHKVPRNHQWKNYKQTTTKEWKEEKEETY